jgi:hypothetical protein
VDADGNWTDAGNWTPSGPPTTGSDVSIDTTDTHTITYDAGNLSINDLTVGNDGFTVANGMLIVGGAANFGGAVEVAQGATLQLSGGGSAGTPTASFTVDSGATLNFTGGTFSVEAGGTISGTGLITLTGGLLDLGSFSVTTSVGFIQTYGALTGTER